MTVKEREFNLFIEMYTVCANILSACYISIRAAPGEGL